MAKVGEILAFLPQHLVSIIDIDTNIYHDEHYRLHFS